MAEFISDGPQATLKFGEEYSKNLKRGDIVVLNGEMGAGKTVFCKGIAKGLGIENEVLSPTYAYMNDYDGKLYHFDCYRLTCGEQAEAMGLCDYFYADGVCVIEWAQNIQSVLPEKKKTVTIVKTGENVRKIIYE